jgi:hypothetical protein
MHGMRRILRNSSRIGVQFLSTDLDLVSTFLALASNSGNLENNAAKLEKCAESA